MRIRPQAALAVLFALAFAWCVAGREWKLLLPLLLLAVSSAYLLGLARLWRGAGFSHGVAAWRAVCFLAGMLLLYLALSGPVDELADGSFSIHMIQHVLLMKAIPPLLLLGNFPPVLVWALGKGTARRGAQRWNRSTAAPHVWKKLTNPWVALGLFSVSLWAWHAPGLFQLALRNEAVHDLEHLFFLATSLLFWWFLVQNGRDQTTRYGTAVIYMFVTLMEESALGALLAFSSKNWYPLYTGGNPWGMTALADQQLAGMIMWLPTGILFTFLIIGYFGAWLEAIEKRSQVMNTSYAHTGDRNG